MNKIIFFELNEVPLKIFDYYINARPNSWLAKNYSNLSKYETFSENKGHLSPWSTWPTMHRGVSNEKHFIADFNVDLTEANKAYPAMWEILANKGINTGVFGSLHSYPLPQNLEGYDFYIPDVFAAEKDCKPKSVELFQDINLKLSRKSSRNVDNSIPIKSAFQLLANSGSLGFKANTFLDVGNHLFQEQLNKWKVVRRRTYQTVLAFDVFFKLLKTDKPDFVTFFTNHVASTMHRYWAALFPTEYKDLKFDKEWQATYNNEIVFTMDEADKMLSKLAKFVDNNPDYKLVIASSMGQEAHESEPIETQLYIVKHDKFMSNLGVTKPDGYKLVPAMLPQHNYFISDEFVDTFENNLKNASLNGELLSYRKNGTNQFSIDMGQQNMKTIEIKLNGTEINFEDFGLENTIIQDKSNATAYHIPEGHLFTYHPAYSNSKINTGQLMTCDILPIMMNNFGLKPEGYMNKTEIETL